MKFQHSDCPAMQGVMSQRETHPACAGSVMRGLPQDTVFPNPLTSALTLQDGIELDSPGSLLPHGNSSFPFIPILSLNKSFLVEGQVSCLA